MIRRSEERSEKMDFYDCDDLNMEVRDHTIVISTVHSRLSLEERIAKYGSIRRFPETKWGKPVGREKL